MRIRQGRGLMLGLPLLFLAVSPVSAAAQEAREGWRITSLGTDPAPGGMAAGDVNGDGTADLIVTGGNAVLVFAGDGAGAFSLLGRSPAGDNPVGVEPADLNGDGRLDLLIANHDTEYVTLLMGDGKGGFRAASHSPLRLGLDPHPHVVRTADMDGDGQLDLLVDERNREGIRVLRGLGGARFERPGMLIRVGGDPYRGMAVGDLNGDGRPDMVTPNPGEAAVIMNMADGGLRRTGTVPASAPFGIGLADLDGDGTLDLVSASESGTLDLFRGKGDGSFERLGEARRVAAGAKRFVAGDFNGDGTGDAAMVNYMWTGIVLLIGGPDGVTLSRVAVPGEHPWGLAAADFDGDGRDDLAVGDEGTERLYILLSPPEGPL